MIRCFVAVLILFGASTAIAQDTDPPAATVAHLADTGLVDASLLGRLDAVYFHAMAHCDAGNFQACNFRNDLGQAAAALVEAVLYCHYHDITEGCDLISLLASRIDQVVAGFPPQTDLTRGPDGAPITVPFSITEISPTYMDGGDPFRPFVTPEDYGAVIIPLEPDRAP